MIHSTGRGKDMSLRSLAPSVFALVASVGLVPSAAAQEFGDTVRLKDVVVTATRVPVSPNAVTASVTTLAGAELEARGVRFVADALREVPGMAVVPSGSWGSQTSLFLRGGESDYVKVLVDGVPQNQSGGAFDWANLTLDNVDRIEIVRGPASVLYGSDAVSGVVQIFTRRGAGRTSARIRGEGGSFGSVDLSAGASGAAAGLGWSADVSRAATDGIYEFNSGYRNTAASAALHADLRGTSAGIVARVRDYRFEYPTDFAGIPSDSNQLAAGTTYLLSAELGRRLGERFELRFGAGGQQTDGRVDDRADHPGDTLGFAFASRRETRGQRGTLDLRMNAFPTGLVALTAGVQLEHETERSAGVSTSNFGGGAFTEEETPFDRGRTTVGYYGQAVVELAGGLAANVNARLDDNSAFGTFRTWRAGAAWRLPTGTRLRVSAGRAFKAPTFCEQFCDAPFIVGDPALVPERSTTWEAGVEQALAGRRLTLFATWFDQRFRDIVFYDGAAAAGAPNYRNGAAARARGLETGLTLLAGGRVTAGVTYTWLRAEATDDAGQPSPTFTAGERLLRRPAHTAAATLAWRPTERITLGGSVNVVGERFDVRFDETTFTSERTPLAAYATVDLSALAEVLPAGAGRPGLSLTARAENVLDEEYVPVYGFRSRGRAVFAGGRLAY